MNNQIRPYRKRPVEVDAVQFAGFLPEAQAIVGWIQEEGGTAAVLMQKAPKGCAIAIRTLQGHVLADASDWIIKASVGDFYPCKDVVFAATYEQVDA